MTGFDRQQCGVARSYRLPIPADIFPGRGLITSSIFEPDQLAAVGGAHRPLACGAGPALCATCSHIFGHADHPLVPIMVNLPRNARLTALCGARYKRLSMQA
jgi:hypothetical protein